MTRGNQRFIEILCSRYGEISSWLKTISKKTQILDSMPIPTPGYYGKTMHDLGHIVNIRSTKWSIVQQIDTRIQGSGM